MEPEPQSDPILRGDSEKKMSRGKKARKAKVMRLAVAAMLADTDLEQVALHDVSVAMCSSVGDENKPTAALQIMEPMETGFSRNAMTNACHNLCEIHSSEESLDFLSTDKSEAAALVGSAKTATTQQQSCTNPTDGLSGHSTAPQNEEIATTDQGKNSSKKRRKRLKKALSKANSECKEVCLVETIFPKPPTYTQAAESHLAVAVVTRPLRELTKEESEQLQKAIEDKICEGAVACLENFKPLPSFRGTSFLHDGSLITYCNDEKSLAWLKDAVKGLKSPKEGTSLEVIPQRNVWSTILKIKATLFLPDAYAPMNVLHCLLAAQNARRYNILDWSLYNASKYITSDGEKGTLMEFGIPEPDVAALNSNNRAVSYMMRTIYVHLPNTANSKLSKLHNPVKQEANMED